MIIEFIESRNYSGIGLRKIGEIAEVDNEIGEQFIEQGFAKRHAATTSYKPKKTDIIVADIITVNDKENHDVI